MIDLHSHVLPGIDDGPSSPEGSLALARAAAASGTRTLLATPHVNGRYPNTPEVIAGAASDLRERIVAERIELELLEGAEVAMTRVGELDEEDLAALRLGQGPWLLLEPPFTPVAPGLEEIVIGLQSRGYRVLLAHPERCPAIQRDPALLAALVRRGVLGSLTAGSLVGRFGEQVRRLALGLAEDGLVHNVASDAHDEVNRGPSVAAQIDRAGLEELREWLTEDVPRAILDGAEAIPPRPATRPLRQRRGLRRLRR